MHCETGAWHDNNIQSETTGLKHLNDSKAFLKNRMIWMIFIKILKNKIKIKTAKYWLFFMIWLVIRLVIKKLNLIVTELFVTGRKLNISLVFITQFYFAVPKYIRLNSTHYFIMTIPNKQELQQIAFNHLSDIDFKDFTNLSKKYTAKPHSLLVIDITLASDNPLCFRENFFENI